MPDWLQENGSSIWFVVGVVFVVLAVRWAMLRDLQVQRRVQLLERIADAVAAEARDSGGR
jgi:hypothetical protein